MPAFARPAVAPPYGAVPRLVGASVANIDRKKLLHFRCQRFTHLDGSKMGRA
jgi:hypothetical protein